MASSSKPNTKEGSAGKADMAMICVEAGLPPRFSTERITEMIGVSIVLR